MAVDFVATAANAVMGISNLYLEEANARARNTVAQANAYASNLVRAANNELTASRGHLSRYVQSVNNQRTLESSATQAEAALVNYRRSRDAQVADSLENQIASAEQAGRTAAAAALSGLTGGVADWVAGTAALRAARLRERQEQAVAQGDADAGTLVSDIMRAGWESVVLGGSDDSFDYSKDVPVVHAAAGNLLTASLGGQSAKGLAETSSFFAGRVNDFFGGDEASTAYAASPKRQRTITGGR